MRRKDRGAAPRTAAPRAARGEARAKPAISSGSNANVDLLGHFTAPSDGGMAGRFPRGYMLVPNYLARVAASKQATKEDMLLPCRPISRIVLVSASLFQQTSVCAASAGLAKQMAAMTVSAEDDWGSFDGPSSQSAPPPQPANQQARFPACTMSIEPSDADHDRMRVKSRLGFTSAYETGAACAPTHCTSVPVCPGRLVQHSPCPQGLVPASRHSVHVQRRPGPAPTNGDAGDGHASANGDPRRYGHGACFRYIQ